MIEAENVYIGFGKAAKTLAFKQANRGESVVVIEESDQMYGGTCINIACIPSKFLYEMSTKPKVGGSEGDNYKTAVLNKKATIAKLRNSNLHKLVDQPTIKLLNARASFSDAHTLDIVYGNGQTDQVVGQRIFINTGAHPNIPDINGLSNDPHLVTSTELLDQERLPKSLVIIGGGFIGMEFATTFSQFGSQVTIINRHDSLVANFDEDVAQVIQQNFDQLGVRVLNGTQVTNVIDNGAYSTLSINSVNGAEQLVADTILVATGRSANIDGLSLEKAGISFNNRGVIVDKQLKTNVDGVWAMGDVRGGPQFTYISLDDYRIVFNQLYGDASKTTDEQELVPHTVFLNPPLSQIGLSEREAKRLGVSYRIGKVPVAGMPKAHILGNTSGFYKVLVGKDDKIIGATLLAPEAHEVINIISLAMHARLPYQYLRDQIYAHPTMAEGLNDAFEMINPV